MHYTITNKINLIGQESKLYKLRLIRDLPDQEKPREKLLEQGVERLSSAELLSIVFGVGTKKEEVSNMATRLIREYGENGIAFQKDPRVIHQELDLPLSKACQVVACFELGRRFYQKKPSGAITIRTAEQAYELLQDMNSYKKEQIRALYLNNHYQLVHDEVISIGTIDATILQAREVFQPAFEYAASAIIIAHNHPSGILTATKADTGVTKKLVQAGELLGIEILDHLIIGNNKFISII